MNLSLAVDVLRRQPSGAALSPPGCSITFLDHPVPSERRHRAVPLGIVVEHRYAFWLWLKVKTAACTATNRSRVRDCDYRPPDLLTLDWHDDIGGECDFIESELRRLDQDDETEVGFFCWAGLRSLNDGHVAPAMWLNAVGDVYAVVRQYGQRANANHTFTDRYGRKHRVVYLRQPSDFYKAWPGGNGLLWDIDMDYFTEKRQVPDQRYTPMLSDEAVARELDVSHDWVQSVLTHLRGVTIALEPEYTGGITNSLHLLRQWERVFFDTPLFAKGCSWKNIVQ